MLYLSTEGHADTPRGEEVGRTVMFSRSCSSASLRTYALPVFFFLPSTIDLRVWSGDSFKQVSCGVSRWVSSESYVQVKVRVGSAPHTLEHPDLGDTTHFCFGHVSLLYGCYWCLWMERTCVVEQRWWGSEARIRIKRWCTRCRYYAMS